MHDAGAVDAVERGGHPGRQTVQKRPRQRAALRYPGCQRGPVDELGDQVRHLAVEHDIEHLGGAEPGHSTRGLRLAAEALAELLVPGVLGTDHFDRHRRATVGRDVIGEEYRAHAAFAQPAEHTVGAESARVAGQQGPGRGRPARCAVRRACQRAGRHGGIRPALRHRCPRGRSFRPNCMRGRPPLRSVNRWRIAGLRCPCCPR
jgi:hypothetical protein